MQTMRNLVLSACVISIGHGKHIQTSKISGVHQLDAQESDRTTLNPSKGLALLLLAPHVGGAFIPSQPKEPLQNRHISWMACPCRAAADVRHRNCCRATRMCHRQFLASETQTPDSSLTFDTNDALHQQVLPCRTARAATCKRLVKRRKVIDVAAAAAAAIAAPHGRAFAAKIPIPPPLTPDTLCACVAVHSTSDFDKWLNTVYLSKPAPEDMSGCLRCIVGRCLTVESALVLSFFPSSMLPAARSFYGMSSTGAEHVHFLVPKFFRTPAITGQGSNRFVSVEPLANNLLLQRGDNLMFGAHGLTVGFDLWTQKFTSESSDAELKELGVKTSVVGQLLPGSTDAPFPGPAVLHATATPQEAVALAEKLSAVGDRRVQQAIDLGIIKTPLYSLAATIVRDDANYGGRVSS